MDHQIQDVIDLIPYDWVGVGRNEDGGGEFSAILYRSSVVAVKAAQTLAFRKLRTNPVVSHGIGSLPRIATWAHFVTSSDGRELLYEIPILIIEESKLVLKVHD